MLNIGLAVRSLDLAQRLVAPPFEQALDVNREVVEAFASAVINNLCVAGILFADVMCQDIRDRQHPMVAYAYFRFVLTRDETRTCSLRALTASRAAACPDLISPSDDQ